MEESRRTVQGAVPAGSPMAGRARGTSPLDPRIGMAAAGRAVTTPLDAIGASLPGDEPLPEGLLGKDERPTPPFPGLPMRAAANQPGAIALPPDAPPPAPPAVARSWKMVEMDGGDPADPLPGTGDGDSAAARSWGMLSMKDDAPAPAPVEDGPQTSRTWGLVGMDDSEAPATPVDNDEPMFRTWGMVGMKADPPPAPAPEPRPAPEPPPQIEPPAPTLAPKPPTSAPELPTPAPELPTPAPELPTPAPEPPAPEPAPAAGPDARSAAIEKIKGHLDPVTRTVLDKLDTQGMLDKQAADGQTILDMLARTADMPLSDAARKLGYSTEGILYHTIDELDNPGSIRQKTETDCVWTNLRFLLASTDPARYVQTAMNLYRDGQATLDGGGSIKLGDPIPTFDLGGTLGQFYYRNGALWLDYQGTQPMSALDWVKKMVTEPQAAEQFFKENPALDNPLIQGAFAALKKGWDGQWKSDEAQQEFGQMVAIAGTWLKISPAMDPTGGLRVLADSFQSLFKPPQQIASALPDGVPLSEVSGYLGGVTGYTADSASRTALDAVLERGSSVSVAFTTDDGQGLHMTSIVGRTQEGDYIVYDPESPNGPRAMPADVLAGRAAAVFLPATAGVGLAAVSPKDSREVGGGRLSWRAVGG